MKILELLTKRRLLGNFGERAARRYLKKSGYRILSTNFVGAGYEIDIIAKKKNVLAFIEVKARTLGSESPKEPRPASSVTPDKQRKIIEAAWEYLSLNSTKDLRKRFDIIEVLVSEKNGRKKVSALKHLEGAFNINTAFTPHGR